MSENKKEKQERRDLCVLANSLSPRLLWERWGYFCDPVSASEMRVYGKDGSGAKTGPCLYRSFYNHEKNMWFHMKRDPVSDGHIMFLEIPGNDTNWGSYRKNPDGSFLLDEFEVNNGLV